MSTQRPFFAARIEDRWNRGIGRLVRNRGWRERVIGYVGYGTPEFVRIICRVVLSPGESDRTYGVQSLLYRRGWRNFFTAPAERTQLEVRIGNLTWQGWTGRGGLVDVRLEQRGLTPGWHRAEVRGADSETAWVPVQIIDPKVNFGLVSDIDDTVITTALPRPLLAAWNTFVVRETARQAIPGMAQLYRTLLDEHPGAPIFYLSTGAWNVVPTLMRFFRRNGFPLGPLLLTDWGPTNTGWFRSGRAHKERMLRRLALELPNISWVLIGDDGQHDPSIYGGFAQDHPERVRAIAIRQLSPGEQVLAHGTPGQLTDPPAGLSTPEVRGPDGLALGRALGAADRVVPRLRRPVD